MLAFNVGVETGGPFNFDTHGDTEGTPKNPYYGYGKGNRRCRHITVKAAFDGNHGWFWRNRSKGEVSVILKIDGDYQDIKRVL